MQAVRPSQVKPRGGDITCKCKGTLAEQKPEKKKVEMAHDLKWLSKIDTRNSHAWKANDFPDLLPNITQGTYEVKTQENAV